MGFSRQGYWSGLPCPPVGNLPNPGIKPRSQALQADALPSEPPGKFIKGEAAKRMAGKGEPQLALAPDLGNRAPGTLWGASWAGEEAGGASLLSALLHPGAAWPSRVACWAFLENSPVPVQTSALEIGGSPETDKGLSWGHSVGAQLGASDACCPHRWLAGVWAALPAEEGAVRPARLSLAPLVGMGVHPFL